MASDAGYKMDISSSAPSYAQGGTTGTVNATFGDFNYKTASGASSVGGLSLPTVAIIGAVALALAWIVARKPSRG
jgi:hypothetical protein